MQRKPGAEPKPFGYPVDITPLAVLSSLTENTIMLSCAHEVNRVIFPVMFVYIFV